MRKQNNNVFLQEIFAAFATFLSCTKVSSVANEPWGAGEDFAHVHTLLVNEEGVCLHRNVVFQL